MEFNVRITLPEAPDNNLATKIAVAGFLQMRALRFRLKLKLTFSGRT